MKRSFVMRDGEKFFADGRDNANFELKQQQMKRAGSWRIGLRLSVLQQLSTLGRDARAFQPQWSADGDYSFANGPLDGPFGGNAVRLVGVNSYTGFTTGALSLGEDKSRFLFDSFAFHDQGVIARPMSGPVTMSGPVSALGVDALADAPADQREMSGEKAEKELFEGEVDGEPFAEGDRKAGVEPGLVSMEEDDLPAAGAEPLSAYSRSPWARRRMGLAGRLSFGGGGGGGFGGGFAANRNGWFAYGQHAYWNNGEVDSWLNNLFGSLPPAPSGKTPPAAKQKWPEEVIAISKNLLRTGQFGPPRRRPAVRPRKRLLRSPLRQPDFAL